jgi:hypothetical protein
VAPYNFKNQPVITSILCFQRDADSFFAPAALGHNGYAADGTHYTAGVRNASQQASWHSEAPSSTRGNLATFPPQVLVLVSRGSIILLDATSESLDLWMVFYFGDQLAYADNGQEVVAGYIASTVCWNNGLLTVTLVPDPGAASLGPTILTLDFTQDRVYADNYSPSA